MRPRDAKRRDAKRKRKPKAYSGGNHRIGLAGLATAYPRDAAAQGAEASYAAAFDARIANPSDTTTLGAFIDIAVREGQYDQALSTVEQHLIAHPRDARARLVAGRLYHHLGSYELARRQVNHALDIGTLNEEDTAEAQDLLRRIEKAIAGWSGAVHITGGVRAEWIEFDNGTDRDDLDPFVRVMGTLRQDLKTATRDAIVYSGYVEASHRFYDVDLSVNAGDQDYVRGMASVTWDKGLPDFGIESLRMLLSGYVRGESFDSDGDDTEYGTSVRFTFRPTVDSFVYAGASFGWIDGSQNVLAEERVSWEAGASHRISGSWTAGLAIKGSHDYLDGDEIGNAWMLEASLGGVVYTLPNQLVWTYQLSAGLGERESPDLSLGLPAVIDADFWQISSRHDFQIAEKQFISLDTTYSETDYDVGTAVDRQSLQTILSFTQTLD